MLKHPPKSKNPQTWPKVSARSPYSAELHPTAMPPPSPPFFEQLRERPSTSREAERQATVGEMPMLIFDVSTNNPGDAVPSVDRQVSVYRNDRFVVDPLRAGA